MDEDKKTILYIVVLLILAGTIFSFPASVYQSAFESDDYSPAPRVIDEIINPDRKPVEVFGRVVYDCNFTPVVGLSVRLFAADELKSENVTTDSNGYFYGTLLYDTSQIIKVTFEDKLYLPNIPIDEEGLYFLGEFYL